MEWSPDYKSEFDRRIKLLSKLNGNPERQSAVRVYYSQNPIAFINDWGITYDPRNKPPKPRTIPFLLFPRQEELVTFLQGCLNDKESGLVEKSRDMGATWLCSAYSVWMWLFKTGSAIGWGSRKREYVDKKGDPKAIFPKIREFMRYLPDFLMPDGFSWREHDNFMRIINPANGSTITGEAGDNIGRGGRTTIYFKDEAAHYERPELIEAALGDNTDVQIDMSSVNGTGNVFYRRRMNGEIWKPDKDMPDNKVRVFIFDWRDDPRKTEQWYERRRTKAMNEGLEHKFKQEVDRDYSGSLEGIIIPQKWVKASVDAHIKLGIDIEGDRHAFQDVADGGGDKNALIMRHGILINYANHWGGQAGEAARVAVPECLNNKVYNLSYDSVGVGAGFKAEVNTMRREGGIPKNMKLHPWNGGSKPLDPDDPIIDSDPESPLNKDQYDNLKAQSWFRMRARFYKTYQAVVNDQKYPHDELVSISSNIQNLHDVCLEMSQPVRKTSKSGKTSVDKKPQGAKSPNLADAVVGCFNPNIEYSILDVI